MERHGADSFNGTSIGAADVDFTRRFKSFTTDYSPDLPFIRRTDSRVSKTGTQKFHGRRTNTTEPIFNANPWLRSERANKRTSPLRFITISSDTTSTAPSTFPTILMRRSPKCFGTGTEWVRYVFTDTNTMLVPTLAMRTGDFSELLNPTNIFYGESRAADGPQDGSAFSQQCYPRPRYGHDGIHRERQRLGI